MPGRTERLHAMATHATVTLVTVAVATAFVVVVLVYVGVVNDCLWHDNYTCAGLCGALWISSRAALWIALLEVYIYIHIFTYIYI